MNRLCGFRRVPWWIRFDWILFVLIVLLCALGLYTLESASASISEGFVKSQMLFLLFGSLTAIGIALLETRVLETLAYPIFLFILILLLLVLVAGKEINGARRWLEVGILLQPSEFAKVAAIIALSRFLADRPRVDGYGFLDILWSLLIIAPSFLLIFLEPDLGTSIVFLLICFTVLVMARIRGETLFAYLMIVLLSIPLVWELGIIRDYQKTRVLTFLGLPKEIALLEFYGGILCIFLAISFFLFGVKVLRKSRRFFLIFVLVSTGFAYTSTQYLNEFYTQRTLALSQEGPEADRARKLRKIREEYQPRQSEIAISSGGLFGKGYKAGSQTQLRFLPIAWSDYIFSAFCEENGFVGGLFLLALYLALVLWCLKISLTARDRFGSFVAIGCGAFFFWHVIINIAMVTRLLPVVGVTLPLFSSGGSSLSATFLIVGLLFHVAIRRQQ